MSQQQTSNAGTEGTTPAGGQQTTTEDKTFTQADVDRIVQDRLTRERNKIGDLDDLRRKAEKYDELEAQNKTDLEKANTRAETAEKLAADLEAKLKDTSLSNAIKDAAGAAGFIDANDAAALIDRSSIEFDGDVPKNLDKLLGALAKAKPHLVKEGAPAPTTGSGDGGPQGSTTTTNTPSEMFGDHVAAKLGLK